MAQVLAVAGATGTLGRSVVTAARDAGHEVRRIARSTGVDLLTGDGLPEALRGADAVIDCSKPPTLEEQEATRWFTTAMRTLGAAAESAGIRRTVVISIVGIDRMQDYGFYRAQLVHEDAARAHCPGPVVVRPRSSTTSWARCCSATVSASPSSTSPPSRSTPAWSPGSCCARPPPPAPNRSPRSPGHGRRTLWIRPGGCWRREGMTPPSSGSPPAPR